MLSIFGEGNIDVCISGKIVWRCATMTPSTCTTRVPGNIVIVVTVLVATLTVCNADSCTWESPAGVTFDLSPLHTDSWYAVMSKYAGTDPSKNYTYYFNVCGNTGDIPGSGPNKDGDACLVTSAHGGELQGPAPAFRVSNLYDECSRLGDGNSAPTWSLMEPEDPSYGVVLTYTGGNLCKPDWSQPAVASSLRLMLACDTEAVSFPQEAALNVVQNCDYELHLRTAYGCPVECPIVNGHLCNQHGICGYDAQSSRVACYCNVGWTGADCSERASSGGVSAVVVVLIIVVILLAAVVAAVVYMYLKLRRLVIDPDSYKDLSGKFNTIDTLVR